MSWGSRALLLALCCLTWASAARAEVVRHAVVIGNDIGNAGEPVLRFAEEDARKVFAVLRELGGFRPENMVLLEGRSDTEIQRVLISVNSRIRADASAGRSAALLVYYSGHADAEALHPGPAPLELALLERLVQGSPAAFRILVLDACRSGTLTRVKGGQPVPPFKVTLPPPREGVAFLTSSSANEDAQESDALQGSFFTHYLTSGLRGAADHNQDGAVSLDEVYAYTYEHTLRASSRTLYGTQHPTFRLDLRGHGAVPLTWVRRAPRAGRLQLPEGRGFLLFAGSEGGSVVAEVGRDDAARTIALDPGPYFVRGRATDHLIEGTVQIAPGQETQLDPAQLQRVEYARLARKGDGERTIAQGPWLGYSVRTPLWSDASLCHGARGGYAIDLRELTLSFGAAFCRSTFENASLRARADELRLDTSALRVIDFPFVSLGLGATLGAAWMRQSFDSRGRAPARNGWLAFPGAVVSLAAELGGGWYPFLETVGRLSLFRQSRDNGSVDTIAVPGMELTLGASKRF